MNIIDSIIHIYEYLIKGSIFLTPFRKAVRQVADNVIPARLLKERLPEQKFIELKGKRIIVSFTSFPARIEKAHIVVRMMKRQTVRPDKIVLWLSKSQFNGIKLPETLTSLEDDVFEIRLVENDVRSHKKYCYAFKEFKDDLVVLIDDDIYYHSRMIEGLLKGLETHPDSVICQYGSIMRYNNDGTLPSFSKWWKEEMRAIESRDFFLGTGGGSMFQPNKIIDTILDTELATKLTPMADDIWVNAMIRLSGLSIYKVKYGLLLQMTEAQKTALKKQNSYEGGNDEQFRSIINYFVKEKNVNPFERRES